MGIFFSDEAEAMVLQVMVSHSGISIESSQNPFQKLIIIRIPQLNMEPLRPSFEPTVRAFHISISPRTVYFTGSGLYLKGKMIIIFFQKKKRKKESFGAKCRAFFHVLRKIQVFPRQLDVDCTIQKGIDQCPDFQAHVRSSSSCGLLLKFEK